MAADLVLAASGGGHLRQLLQLVPHLERDFSLVSEDTALAHSVSDCDAKYFLPHFAIGQRQTDGMAPFLMGMAGNALKAAWLAVRLRPKSVITTGAGAMFFFIIFSRIFGARIVYIESLARVKAPSRIGQRIKPYADLAIVQWPDLRSHWPEAILCHPLKTVPIHETPGRDIMVTVGTVKPFDRMISAVDQLAENGELTGVINAQIGHSDYKAKRISVFQTCSYEAMQAYLRQSRLVITHGGTGSLLSALFEGCAVVAMPRRHELGEHYDDHQFEIVDAFAAQGLIEAARDASELEPAIKRALSRPPVSVVTDATEMAQIIGRFLSGNRVDGR